MKLALLITVFSSFFLSASAQQYVIGNVLTEDGVKLSGVMVMNMNTEERTITDSDGIFMIRAQRGEEIRFMRSRFERYSMHVQDSQFASPVKIVMKQAAQLIEEVEIGFVPSGNLKRDVAKLETPAKVKKLNESMNSYMKTHPAEVSPQLRQPSTLALGPNYSAGQVNVLGLLTYVVKKTRKQPATPSYAEQEAFYRRVKTEVNMNYFANYGLDEFQFEQLLVYADRRYELTKNFRNNFSIAAVENYLKMSLKDFLNTQIKPSAIVTEKG